MGRLSNPPDSLESLTGQGIAGSGDHPVESSKRGFCPPFAAESDVQETPGRLSNPGLGRVRRRLDEVEIDKLVGAYLEGRTLADLAGEMGIHKRTVAAHLEAHGVQRRVNRRRMSENDVGAAARCHRGGDSLAKVALAFDVEAATVQRELIRAGVAIRPRPGWA